MKQTPKWDKPMGSPAAVAEAAANSLQNPPESLSYQVDLNGFGAARLSFAISILQTAYQISEQEAANHVMRLGAEFFIQKMGAIYKLAEAGDTGLEEV